MKIFSNRRNWFIQGLLAVCTLLFCACEKRTIVEQYTDKNILILGNSSEPKALDLQTVSGVIESNIIRSLYEGLCLEHPSKEGVHLPGAAIAWKSNDDFTQWSFELQPNGKWSDGKPVTTEDFIFAYHRILNPDFAAEYSSMLYYIKGAEDYSKNHRAKILSSHLSELNWEEIKEVNLNGKPSQLYKETLSKKIYSELSKQDQEVCLLSKGLNKLNKEQLLSIKNSQLAFAWPKNLSEHTKNILLDSLISYVGKDLWDIANVGVTAQGSHKLIIDLRGPIPFLPDLTKHYTWFPVPKHLVLEKGSLTDQKKSAWTEPGVLVGNGAFKLTEWKFNNYIHVEKNQYYWDAETVSLDGVRFIPVENQYTEARMFFAGQLHKTYTLASEMIEYSKQKTPENLRQETYLGCGFLRFNVTEGPLANIKLRKAMAYAIDAQAIIDNVLKGGQKRATGIVPPTSEYAAAGITQFDPDLAKAHLQKFLDESKMNLEDINITFLTTSKDSSKIQAEAYQDMWKRHLGIKVSIEQSEWTTYLDRMSKLDYNICTAGWIGDYPDPTTFLDMWKKGDGNNRTGWHSAEYEALLAKAEKESDPRVRISILRKAEKLFIEDHAILPVSWSTTNYLLDDNVKGWRPLLMNNQPLKFIRLKQQP